MSDDQMLKCLIAFILGWIVSRQMGNGFSVGANMADYLEMKSIAKKYPPCGTYKYDNNGSGSCIKGDNDYECRDIYYNVLCTNYNKSIEYCRNISSGGINDAKTYPYCKNICKAVPQGTLDFC